VELRDTTPFEYTVTLDEGDSGGKWLVVEGILQRADAGNANKRVYPRAVLEKALSNEQFLESIKARGVLGELDHPSDGKSSLSKISHIVLESWMEPDGLVKGKVLVLNNPDGERLKELFRAGARVGISSRGSGSVRPGSGQWSGYNIVEDDFRLSTWDFVTTPSTFGAYMTPSNEGLKLEGKESQDNFDASYGADVIKNEQSKDHPTFNAPTQMSTNAAPEVDAQGHRKDGNSGDTYNDVPQAKTVMDKEGCPFGDAGCGQKAEDCDCLSAFDDDNHKHEEDESESMRQTMKDKKVLESLVRQNRLTERIAVVDRATSGRLISALVQKIRDISASGQPIVQAEDTDRVTQLEAEKADLNKRLSEALAANEELKKVVATVKQKIAEAHEEGDEERNPEVKAFVEGLIAKDADALDWQGSLLEAESVEEAKTLFNKMKKDSLAKSLAEGLPAPGTKSTLTETKAKNTSDDPGVSLFRRAQKSMGRTSRHLGQKDNGIR
jgi:hypothetical protein